MPKKRGKPKRQVMNLTQFLGPEAHTDNLPTAPSRNPDAGDHHGYRGGGGRRHRTDEPWKRGGQDSLNYEPSKAEESNSWRSVRSSGNFRSGGGGGYNSGGYNSRSRNQGPGLSTGNRFDSRWGGGSQDARMGGDTRPAHLRRFSKQNSRNAEFEAEQKRLKEEHAKKQADAKAKAKAREEAERKEKHTERSSSYASNLRGPAVRYKNKKSPLEIAVEDSIGLKSLEELNESFSRLNLRKSPVEESARVLGNGLIDRKFTCEEFIQSIQSNCRNQANCAKICINMLQFLHSRGPTKYQKVVDGVDSESLIALVNADGLEGQELTNFLASKEIYFLKPMADISEQVHSELKSSGSADVVMKLISDNFDEKQFPTNLIPIVMGHVLSRVYESKEELSLGCIQDFAAVLKRCQEGMVSETAILFAVQRAWFREGKEGKRIRAVFQKLHEHEVVTFDALATWRDDRSASNNTGKSDALFGVAGWITDITPVEPEEDDEEEADEEGEQQEDEYLRNPNAEFYN